MANLIAIYCSTVTRLVLLVIHFADSNPRKQFSLIIMASRVTVHGLSGLPNSQ
ncbi:MAG: hypothetical protein M0Z50_05635 [Planctomycetia bacterium]|nr:hypothetical protein [Planctomycetia bacterium]